MKHSRHAIKAATAALAVALVLLSSSPQSLAAEERERYRDPEAVAMIIDGLIVRPVSFAATLVGGVIYVVTLPFSALGGNAGEAGDTLVVQPAEYTFTRCLGCFRELP